MQVDPEFLKKHYASLSDEAFNEVDRNELVGIAQRIYDEERSTREPSSPAPSVRPATPSKRPESEPEWVSDATCACTFPTSQGQYDAARSEQVREALENAGIPVHVGSHTEPPPENPKPVSEIRILIPSRYSLEAESVLDHEIYNQEVEDLWKTHFEMLSDEEFKDLDFESLISGLTDRLERLRRVYQDEVDARNAA